MSRHDELETSKLWKQSIILIKVVDEFIHTIPMGENYTIAEPLHRASITLTSDIAMATGRGDEKSEFDYNYARGHLFTIKGLTLVAQELGYSHSATPVLVEVETVRRLLDKKISDIEEESKDEN